VKDDDSLCQRQHFVQVAREHHDTRSRRSSTPKPFSNRRGRSNVEPARRVLDYKKLGFAIELSRQYEFLLIPPRKVGGRGISTASADVKFTQELGRVIPNPSRCKSPAAPSGALERDVFREREAKNQRITMAVFWNEANRLRQSQFACSDACPTRERSQ